MNDGPKRDHLIAAGAYKDKNEAHQLIGRVTW